jgi:tripartite ATP-independent transporter DctP family solute receptor
LSIPRVDLIDNLFRYQNPEVVVSYEENRVTGARVEGRIMRRSIVLLAAVFAVVALSAGLAAAAPLTVKLAYNGPPDAESNAVHAFAVNFAKFVEEGTDGAITMDFFPDSQLGTEEERMELLMKSGLNQPIINIASFAGMAPVFPEIYASAVPFMFDSYEAAHIFFDKSRYWNRAQETFREKTGAVLLEAVEEGGFLAFTNSKRPIHSPEDFKGLRFRAMDEGQIAIYEAFGASGTPIPWTELYMALKTGVVDGQMNPAMYIIIGSLYEVQDYMTLANIQYSDQFLVINGDLFDSLTPEQQEVVVDAAKRANVISRREVEAADAEQIEFLKEQGMEVYAPTEEEMNQFRDQGQSAFIEWVKSKVGDEWLDLALECAANANEKAAAE